MHFLEGQPELEYPRSWSYRIICTDETVLRAAVPGIVGKAVQHSLIHVGASGSGRYQRLELSLEVRDQAQRDAIFRALGAVLGVKFVL